MIFWFVTSDECSSWKMTDHAELRTKNMNFISVDSQSRTIYQFHHNFIVNESFTNLDQKWLIGLLWMIDLWAIGVFFSWIPYVNSSFICCSQILPRMKSIDGSLKIHIQNCMKLILIIEKKPNGIRLEWNCLVFLINYDRATFIWFIP